MIAAACREGNWKDHHGEDDESAHQQMLARAQPRGKRYQVAVMAGGPREPRSGIGSTSSRRGSERRAAHPEHEDATVLAAGKGLVLAVRAMLGARWRSPPVRGCGRLQAQTGRGGDCAETPSGLLQRLRQAPSDVRSRRAPAGRLRSAVRHTGGPGIRAEASQLQAGRGARRDAALGGPKLADDLRLALVPF